MYARPFPRVDGPLLCALMSLRFFFYKPPTVSHQDMSWNFVEFQTWYADRGI
jgi:hypothetical protein